MKLKDRNKKPIEGFWRLDVYDGDVERRPLTKAQKRMNAKFIDERRRFYDIMEREFGHKLEQVLLPLVAGEIVSKPIDTITGENIVTTNGKGLLLDRLFAMGSPPTQVNSMGVGNSATTAVVGDTQLLGATPSPTLLAFDALPTRAGLVVTCIRTFATGEGNMNWQELGLFNGVTNGTSILFNRIAPIGAFNKTSAVSIVATVTITQS